jgi:hypothetical protein
MSIICLHLGGRVLQYEGSNTFYVPNQQTDVGGRVLQYEGSNTHMYNCVGSSYGGQGLKYKKD